LNKDLKVSEKVTLTVVQKEIVTFIAKQYNLYIINHW